jgi:hypothetical protein
MIKPTTVSASAQSMSETGSGVQGASSFCRRKRWEDWLSPDPAGATNVPSLPLLPLFGAVSRYARSRGGAPVNMRSACMVALMAKGPVFSITERTQRDTQ